MSTNLVTFLGYNCQVIKTKYAQGGAICLRLVSTENEPIATATVNVPEYKVRSGYLLIKNYSENQGILDALVEAGIVTPTGVTIPVGYCQAELCKLNI